MALALPVAGKIDLDSMTDSTDLSFVINVELGMGSHYFSAYTGGTSGALAGR